MKTDLKSPCSNCPFRSDIKPFLTQGRAEEISEALTSQDGTFSCHKTLERNESETEDEEDMPHIPSEDEQHCAGAMIILEKLEQPNQWMRWMERMGQYNHKELKMDAPVFDDFDEFIDAQER